MDGAVLFHRICLLFGLVALGLFVIFLDILVAQVVGAVSPSVVMPGTSAWLVAWVAIFCSALGQLIVASTAVAVLVVGVFQFSPGIVSFLVMLATVFLVFPQNLLANAVQGFNVLD